MDKFEVRRTAVTVVEAASSSDAFRVAVAREDWTIAEARVTRVVTPLQQLRELLAQATSEEERQRLIDVAIDEVRAMGYRVEAQVDTPQEGQDP